MNRATPELRELARRLLDFEMGSDESVDAAIRAAEGTYEKVRVRLQTLVGIAGFRAVSTRAMALARREVPWLDAIDVQADGSLAGFAAAMEARNLREAVEGPEVLLAFLLGTLVVITGEEFTQRFVRDLWPLVVIEDIELGSFEANE